MATLLEQIANIQTLIDNLEALAFGDENTSATHNGQTRDSLSKAIKGKFDALQTMVQGRLAYETKAAMDAAGAPPAGELAEVVGDSETGNNGLYYWLGSAWVKSPYDPMGYVEPVKQAVANLEVKTLAPESGYSWALVDKITGRAALMVTTSGDVVAPGLQLGDSVVSDTNLTPSVKSRLAEVMNSSESGYVWALVDQETSRAAVAIKPDGTVFIPGFQLSDGSVSFSNFDQSLKSTLPADLPVESGYVWALVDELTGRAACRLHRSGRFEIPDLMPGDSTIGKSTLKEPLVSEATPSPRDVVDVAPIKFRQTLSDIAARTAPGDGSGWVRFPSRETKYLIGENHSGQAIEVRKSSAIDMVGQSYAGDFSITADSITLKGQLSGPSVSNPSGTFVAGDYFQYVNGAGSTSTGTHSGMKVGDLLVYDGSQFVIQAAPGTFSARDRHAVWSVTSAGYFDGKEYAVGDLVIYIGRQPGGGGWQYERWYKASAESGDFCYFGEFDPASGLPVSPYNLSVYQASAAGSAGGITFSEGDYALRLNGVWHHIQNAAPSTFADGDSVFLPCDNADEYEIRRADKSASRVGVRLSVLTSRIPARSSSDLWLLSDSMFGVSGVGNIIISDSGRVGVVQSYGGGQSEQLLGMVEHEIVSNGDRYAGNTLVLWHGQNNQPSGENSAAQVKEACLRIKELASARDLKCLFLSILGQRVMVWNGSRLVCSQHEDQFAKTGHLFDLCEWYKSAFPGQWVNIYEVMLAAATDAADPEFPGMTEKDVADTYGIVPWSFFNPPSGIAWTTDELNFINYWSDPGLPTGGSHLDYYIRTGNGTHGELLVNESGTWVARNIDRTHLSPAGGSALSLGGAGFLNIPARAGISKIITNEGI